MLPLIACKLGPGAQRRRLEAWTSLLAFAVSRRDVEGGVRYTFEPPAAFEERARRLAAAEHECCSFLQFEVTRIGNGLVMTVTADPAAQEALRSVFV